MKVNLVPILLTTESMFKIQSGGAGGRILSPFQSLRLVAVAQKVTR
jgi:hypothetical protein